MTVNDMRSSLTVVKDHFALHDRSPAEVALIGATRIQRRTSVVELQGVNPLKPHRLLCLDYLAPEGEATVVLYRGRPAHYRWDSSEAESLLLNIFGVLSPFEQTYKNSGLKTNRGSLVQQGLPVTPYAFNEPTQESGCLPLVSVYVPGYVIYTWVKQDVLPDLPQIFQRAPHLLLDPGLTGSDYFLQLTRAEFYELLFIEEESGIKFLPNTPVDRRQVRRVSL